jgi:hypothetical protein
LWIASSVYMKIGEGSPISFMCIDGM